jgi:enoyl-CoA hydratase/carnithine racemase
MAGADNQNGFLGHELWVRPGYKADFDILQASRGIVTTSRFDLNAADLANTEGFPMAVAPDETAAPPSDPALLAVEGAVATITLNRPASFNSIDLAIAKRLEQIAAEVEGSDEIKVLVIEGSGRAFCAGGDLQTIGAAAAADTIAPVVGEMLHHYHAFIAALRRMPKIVIASVHGSAAGAGLSLAFMADLCIAAEDARFTPAYSKIGVSPDGGGTVGVTAAVGPRRALQIFLAEDSFSAQQALEWGLVVNVVPAPELKAATRELAHRLAQNTLASIAATKMLVQRAPVTPVEQQLEAERDAIIDCMHTDEARAAIESFTKKGK